jgi:hypothetical protein
MSLAQKASCAYKYSPLSKEDRSVRLLRLLPSATEGAEIKCEIFEYCLVSNGVGHPYEALSYVWGDPTDRKSIHLNGHTFDITKNLHAALLRLRNPFVERVLWVDAICINQQDDGEKEQQIQYMYRVYGQATRVVVWLGDMADNSDQAFEDIRVAGEYQSESMLTGGRQKALSELLRRPWFQRIWVGERSHKHVDKALTWRCRSFKKSLRLEGFLSCAVLQSWMDMSLPRAFIT